MLVASNSPIRVRADLDRRQALQLDAIAVTANVVDLVYKRLIDSIRDWTEPDGIEPLLPDAWGVIDWVFRLDGLVERLRGLTKTASFVVDFRNTSSLVENHRHAVQHLEGTIPAIEELGRAPWGHISWVRRLPEVNGARSAMLQVAGPSLIGANEPAFEVGQPTFPRTDIDYVTLYSANGEAKIGLTGQHEALLRFVIALEDAVRSATPRRGVAVLPIR